jgi:hypothetical protein
MIFATVHFRLAEGFGFDFDLDLVLTAAVGLGCDAAIRPKRGLAPDLLRLPSTERPPASIILA